MDKSPQKIIEAVISFVLVSQHHQFSIGLVADVDIFTLDNEMVPWDWLENPWPQKFVLLVLKKSLHNFWCDQGAFSWINDIFNITLSQQIFFVMGGSLTSSITTDPELA